jgi:hypothetical protein
MIKRGENGDTLFSDVRNGPPSVWWFTLVMG